VDLTGLIFVALGIAWVVYLVPKALQHHDELSRSHSVERFSSTMRVLARREAPAAGSTRTSGRADGRTVVTPAREAAPAQVTTKARRPSAAQIRARREAARRAAQRRRRVLGVVVFLNAVVAGLAGFGVIGWVWQAIPVTLLVAWLVACRVMVKGEQAAWSPVGVRVPRTVFADVAPAPAAASDSADAGAVPVDIDVERNDQGFDEVAPSADTSTIPAVREPLWDPVPTTLPTYVSKPAATRRTVRTIDLDAPGAWTSGRTEESAAIAREADQADRAAKVSRREQRKTGS
jgi:hypothetical protein